MWGREARFARKCSRRNLYRKDHVNKTFSIRIRGTVQGVGFRPAVWCIARDLGLSGDVCNDAEGVLIRILASPGEAAKFVERIRSEAPRLAHIEGIEMQSLSSLTNFAGFAIVESAIGAVRTQVAPDAATCAECLAEIRDPRERRYRYPFTNCTNCGPRLTIVERIPYDRANTSMAEFVMCEACRREYENPADRRFHAQPIACPSCGPKVRLIDADSLALQAEGSLAVEKAIELLAAGSILAVRGVGGYHLACDATNSDTVGRLRQRKRRFGKAFALMARDLDVIRRFAHVGEQAAKILASPAAPIVLLDAKDSKRLPQTIAPGLMQLGFMLPYSPLHHLILEAFDRPLVMTSGNLSDEPQCIEDTDAQQRLAGIADHLLTHNRRIVSRIDDSVVQIVAGAPSIIRRARGFAPAPIMLPTGFDKAPAVLAMGGELKSAFCLSHNRHAILSPHQGDLENASTLEDFERNLELFTGLFEHEPVAVSIDRHPEYLSSQKGRALATARGIELIEVQHHHAHVAACLADNGISVHAAPVLGIVLDGLGLGDDGTLWGGEFLLADYHGYERLASLKPVAMPGGAQAVREPWRNLYAHLDAAMGFPAFEAEFGETRLASYLRTKPTAMLGAMIAKSINSPQASSCGRLFDAVAATLGICPDRTSYEGEAAMRLEAVVRSDDFARCEDHDAYPFAVKATREAAPVQLDPAPMWRRLCEDLRDGISIATIACRFHLGLVCAVADLASTLAGDAEGRRFGTVVLSGGCIQNRWLSETLVKHLQSAGLGVLLHARVPANDGGLALGQAVIAAARMMNR